MDRGPTEPGGCVTAEELVAMVDGELGVERADTVLVHVDQCGRCAEVVASLGAFDSGDRKVGRYQLERVLGSGGMGIVYAAWDPQLRRRVAVKLVRPDKYDAEAAARMLREARALARVSHPNVIAAYDVGEHDGEIYVATELVEGETMGRWQAGRGVHEVVDAWLQVARGLAACHAEGVVHRDVKPANVLVGRDGRVRIGDFGLARHDTDELADVPAGSPPSIGSRVTATGALAGTPAYMSPEQMCGRVDARSDQFALCVALSEALTRSRPEADDAVVLDNTELAAVLSRGVRAEPDERFPSIGALALALEMSILPPRRRPRWPWLVLVAAGFAGALVTWLAISAPVATCTVPPDLWSPARRARLDREAPFHLAPHVDTWLAGWSAASVDACTAQDPTTEQRDVRRRCLDDELAQARELLDAWDRAAPDPVVAHARLDALPHVTACSRAALANAIAPTPVEVVEIAGMRAPMLALAGRRDARDHMATAARLVDQARAVGYAPFTVEMLSVLAAMQAQGNVAAATATLREALALADGGRDLIAQIDARIALIGVLGSDPGGEVAGLDESARKKIAALGGDPRFDADLDMAVGEVARTRHDLDAALAAFERARRSYLVADGPDSEHEALAFNNLAGGYAEKDPSSADAHAAYDASAKLFALNGFPIPFAPWPTTPAEVIEATNRVLAVANATPGGASTDAVLDAELNLASAYLLEDRPEVALDHYHRALELGDRMHLRDGRMVDALAQISALLVDLKRAGEAVVAGKRAAALAEELKADDDIGFALTMYGAALVENGDPVAARAPLERALAIRERIGASARARGNTRWLLAQALEGSDPARARDLATAARLDLAGYRETISATDPNGPYLHRDVQGRIDKIDRWLHR